MYEILRNVKGQFHTVLQQFLGYNFSTDEMHCDTVIDTTACSQKVPPEKLKITTLCRLTLIVIAKCIRDYFL